MYRVLSSIMTVLLLAGAVSAETFGDWQVTVKTDNVAMKTKAWAFTVAKVGKAKYDQRPFMAINCKDVYFGNVAVLNSGDITWRFDNKVSAESFSGREWQGSSGTNISIKQVSGASNSDQAFRYYKTYFKDFVRANKLYVEFDTYADANVQATFSLRGVTRAISFLQDLCWVDKEGLPMSLKMSKQALEKYEEIYQNRHNFSDSKMEKMLSRVEKKYGYDNDH